MATDYSTAAIVQNHNPYQQHAYKNSGHFSPMASGATTPTNVSPTSPRTVPNPPGMPTYAPQIRPPKPAIYVPAALRKTESRMRQSPPKVDSAMDSADSSWSSHAGLRRTTNESIDSGISRITTEEMYNDAPMSPLAGPITRNHWTPDNTTKVCTASACQTHFSFFQRRHHCRKCGGIFCWQHSQQRVRLNEEALFHVDGHWQRACDRCHQDYRHWEQLRSSRHNSGSSDGSGAVQIGTPITPKRPDTQRVGSLATSLQGAWNWSTF